VLGAPFAVTVDAAFQGFLGVAATRSVALLAWYDERGGRSSIRAARVDAMGTVLETTPLVIAEDPSGLVNALSFPAVATDGVGFVVVYSDGGDDTLRVSRVSAEGTVSASRIVRQGSGTASVTFGAGGFVVFSTDEDVNTSTFEVWSTRLGLDGAVVSPPTRIATGPGVRSFPDLAFDGSSFLAVWEDGQRTTRAVSQTDVRAITLDALGQPVGEAFDVAASGVDQAPVVAFDGEAFQVVWFSYSAALTTSVQRAVVSRQRAVRSTVRVSELPRVRQVLPRIAFTTGDRGVVGFEPGPSAQRLVFRTTATSRDPVTATPPMSTFAAPPNPFITPACSCSSSPAAALLGLMAFILGTRRSSK